MDRERFPELIVDLYQIIGELENMFPGRHFTPDGHLVGSLGECLAAHHYGLELTTASSKGYDAFANGRKVEIKATQGKRVALRSCPRHLLVIHLDRSGSFSEIYNGPGNVVWDQVKDKPRPSNGQYQISLTKLRLLMEGVPEKLRLPIQIPQQVAAVDRPKRWHALGSLRASRSGGN
jgi:hypothetical protein